MNPHLGSIVGELVSNGYTSEYVYLCHVLCVCRFVPHDMAHLVKVMGGNVRPSSKPVCSISL